MTAAVWTSALSALTRGFARGRKGGNSAGVDRLSVRDLADLNLPSEVRARIDIDREWQRRDRFGF